MRHSPLRTKLAVLFVLAFLCLNVGGTVCLAYCVGGTMPKASSGHCPHHKAAHHPHKEDSPNQAAGFATESNPVTCTALAINFFSAPLEKKQSPADAVLISEQPLVRPFSVPAVFVAQAPPPATFTPPKIDTRDLRVKNCVIRI